MATGQTDRRTGHGQAHRRVKRRRTPGDVLAGLGALAALVAVLGGVPWALLAFFGSPFPDRAPTFDDLTGTLGESALLTVLVAVVWLAWLQFAVCVLVEVWAGVRGVGVPLRVPLAGGTQSLVHKLVVAVLLLFTATTSVMPAFASTGLSRTAPVTAAQPVAYTAPLAAPEQPAAPLAAPAAAAETTTGATTKIYRVQPPEGRHHESLWEIAEKCLGEGRRYKEIFKLNEGHVQPDGTKLTIASLIRPGWVLEMPADAKHAKVIAVSDLDDYYATGKPAPDPEPPVEKPVEKPPERPVEQAPEPPAETPPPAPVAPPVQTPAPTPQVTAPGNDGHRSSESPLSVDLEWPEGLAAAALLAAGLLAALGRRRRAQMWNRAFGHRIVRPTGLAAHTEAALRFGADDDAARLLDVGLRHLSKSMAAGGRPLPTVYGVHLGHGSLDLWIAPADRNPPAPWQTFDDGQVWRLGAAAIASLDAADLDDVLAPYPGLVSLGTNPNGRILVDLEAAHGLIAVRGPDEQRRAMLAALALELATNRWSDHMRVTLVGFGGEMAENMTAIAPDRIRSVSSLDETLPELEGRSEEVRQALAASGVDSVLTGRSRGVFGEAWMPHYLIMADAPTPEEADRLVALARTGTRMAAGYIVPGDVQGATWVWDLDEAGRLQAGVLGFEVDAQLVREEQYRGVFDLFRTAAEAESVPLPEPEGGAEPPQARESSVDIRLLGGLEVDAPGPMDESRRDVCTEVLVYLATHPNGVHPTVLGGAVWPRGVTTALRDATVARVSDWLGRDARGRPHLYYDDRGRIRLGSEVRIDWAVFRWLLWRSAAEPGSEAAYLSYALDLVRGPLLAGRPRGRYGWLADADLEYEATARIIDVAHRLVTLRLDDGDAPGAVTAARAGLRFAPDEESLWRDLLRAAHAEGDHTHVRAVVDELRHRFGRDPRFDQLHPETDALMEELVPEYHHVPAR